MKAGDLKGIFKNTAWAIFDIMAAKQKKGRLPKKTIKIKQQAANKEELLIFWLNELLSLSAVKGLVFRKFSINNIGAGYLEAVVEGEDINSYKVNTEIKAATFNGLLLRKSGLGWLAEVTFDV
ncbi:MAG: archease [Candidatus Omnitrophota bacterium]